ncbi:MAG TPA: cytochrome b562 [Opitutaceae bacterium]
MKIRSALSLLLVLPAATPLIVCADQANAPATTATATTTATMPPPATPPAAAAAPAAAPDDDKKTELELRMDRMGKAYRKLRKQVADPTQNASSIELASKMMAALKEAEDLTPEKAADLPEDQRPKFVSDFKDGIKAMENTVSKLTDALTAGKNDDAAKIVADMGAMEKKDHKEFKKPDKS